MAGTLVCILCVNLMPDPYAGKDVKALATARGRTTYRQMLQGNPTLLVFLGCILLNGIGNTASYTFIIRVVERLGGGTAEYGLSEFIRAGV